MAAAHLPLRIKLIAKSPLNAYGFALAAVATCECGHQVQLPDDWIATAAMTKAEKDLKRQKLKCSKCGRRAPYVGVYRVP